MKMANKPTKSGSPERAKMEDSVLAHMNSGLTCWKACEKAKVPHSTFMLWVSQDAALADRYAQAREDFIEKVASELMDISDQDPETVDGKKDWAAIQKHKLQVDTRKWLLSKLAPKKYGDMIKLAGHDGGAVKLVAQSDDEKL
jgi:hypothetical protein